MARDDSDERSAPSAEDRRELERIAFAKPETREAAEAAAEALRRLVAADAAGAVVATRPAEPIVATTAPARALEEIIVDGAEDDAEGDSAERPDERPAPRRRSLVPLIVLVGLVVGLVAGVLIAHASPQLFGAAPAAPGPTASADATGSTAARDATAAIDAPQTALDVFPDPGFATTLNLEKRSVHRILTSDDGYTLWIGRTSQDLCLMLTVADENGGDDVQSSCSTTFAFRSGGLALDQGGTRYSWDGSRFTIGSAPTK